MGWRINVNFIFIGVFFKGKEKFVWVDKIDKESILCIVEIDVGLWVEVIRLIRIEKIVFILNGFICF